MILLVSAFPQALETSQLPFERRVERRNLIDKYKALGKTDGYVRKISDTKLEMTFLDLESAQAFAQEALALAQKYNDTVTFEYNS